MHRSARKYLIEVEGQLVWTVAAIAFRRISTPPCIGRWRIEQRLAFGSELALASLGRTAWKAASWRLAAGGVTLTWRLVGRVASFFEAGKARQGARLATRCRAFWQRQARLQEVETKLPFGVFSCSLTLIENSTATCFQIACYECFVLTHMALCKAVLERLLCSYRPLAGMIVVPVLPASKTPWPRTSSYLCS